ncbi:hypothetical protein DYBT9275_01447 [Dyadobacter sp. CECT 9275]|uniref:Uncharacterized protein n=1 Tax=Dyadobacter helix TaxID=2822344 RepID=A0A916J8Y5_9BACT|nr:hypothetical protein [Dyadobacter sp. CECT 9275]CAG4994697.1 hypothetical protein DYBT9275_01447 [Dyadobacter sp. CECT 9275]
MGEKNYTRTIPKNLEGTSISAESQVKSANEEEARFLFTTAKHRLLDVNSWEQLAGKAMASFTLTDEHGSDQPGLAVKGRYFRIEIPGPENNAGQGYDWVKVEEIEEYKSEDVESIGLRVRSAPNPATDSSETAHFYSDESTSTFTVTREKTTVTAAVYDRNTKANTETGELGDKIRNAVVGLAGKLAFSKIQWEKLTKGLLSPS